MLRHVLEGVPWPRGPGPIHFGRIEDELPGAAGAAAGAAAATALIFATTCVVAKIVAVAAAAAPAAPGNSPSILPKCMGPSPLGQEPPT